MVLTIAMVAGAVPLPGLVMEATAAPEGTVSLDALEEDYVAQDGDVLSGETSRTVYIAENAEITLSDATIYGGIICNGTAGITLVGENEVRGSYWKPGIQVGSAGTTLTIRGEGALEVQGADSSAGIGLGYITTEGVTGGNIVIEGGNISAQGYRLISDRTPGGGGAGIGVGRCSGSGSLGDITIKGGTVNAIGGYWLSSSLNNSYYILGDGIGLGNTLQSQNVVLGKITIYDSVDEVNASSIGGDITYIHTEDGADTDVTAEAEKYFKISQNEDGIVIRGIRKATVTFKVENGAWEDGTTADKTVTLTGDTDEAMTLAEENIPAVGSKAEDGFKEGSWDVVPAAGIITEDTTYTYTYAVKSTDGPDETEFAWIGKDGSAHVDTGCGNETGTEGIWYNIYDDGDGGNSKVIFDQADPDGDGFTICDDDVKAFWGLSGTAVLDKGILTYRPYVAICFDVVGEASDATLAAGDVSDWGGLTISYECDVPVSLELSLGDDDDATIGYACPYYSLPKTEPGEGVVKSIAWSQFKQPSWYKGATKISGEEAAGQLVRVMFRIQADPGTYHFRIAGIGSYDAEIPAPEEPVYTITYNLGGGTNAEDNPASYTVDTESFTLADPVRDGYEFEGWFEDAGFTTPATTTIAKGTRGDQTFYAKWIA